MNCRSKRGCYEPVCRTRVGGFVDGSSSNFENVPVICWRNALIVACMAASLLRTPAANADDAYCRKVHARAASEAALLFAPTARAEGIKLPVALQKGASIDPLTAGGGSGYQLRAGMSLSLM